MAPRKTMKSRQGIQKSQGQWVGMTMEEILMTIGLRGNDFDNGRNLKISGRSVWEVSLRTNYGALIRNEEPCSEICGLHGKGNHWHNTKSGRHRSIGRRMAI